MAFGRVAAAGLELTVGRVGGRIGVWLQRVERPRVGWYKNVDL